MLSQISIREVGVADHVSLPRKKEEEAENKHLSARSPFHPTEHKVEMNGSVA